MQELNRTIQIMCLIIILSIISLTLTSIHHTVKNIERVQQFSNYVAITEDQYIVHMDGNEKEALITPEEREVLLEIDSKLH